ncbi:hypothetical protein TCSYLVIO_007127 [Trypanosoma cruzi]|uniref:GRAM domain-containing protein n=2 Tax=Trypanosoma cruzi TaxID=5693 RepID=V5D9R6_TRYCR|nr:hypothetical protein TCSYLVIO_007127 [Trypanosoma cruzi]ESS64186.1 hypothetical protein TCDM_07814 [Trypanosoma cruzi Dm28c]PBJ72498.1 hypothetical protein BCY84_15515 [Trypanosoma cruzi cruzi]PWU88496.1 hypothetical protein C4B63_72g97 [Trypanosoma cruzi]
MEFNRSQAAGNGKYVELFAQSYSGPVPKPLPPCTEPTPDEQYRQLMEEKKNEIGEREQRHAENTAGASGSNVDSSNVVGLFSNAATKLRNVAQQVTLKIERASTEVSSATGAAVRQVERQLNVDRFLNNFPELGAMGEILLADYACTAINGGQRVSGHMHITKNYLCFSAPGSSVINQLATAVLKESGVGSDNNPVLGIRQIIPLTEIACILLSVALETVDHRPPFFLPLPAPYVRPTGLQIYTTKQQLFQFLAFESIAAKAGSVFTDAVKGLPIQRAYNYLDHAWRASTSVPLPGVNYAS